MPMIGISRLTPGISLRENIPMDRYSVSMTFSFSGNGFQDLCAAAEQVKKSMIKSFESIDALQFNNLHYLISPAENEDGDGD
jgi:FPC/CPF motif-containing protein YcgG